MNLIPYPNTVAKKDGIFKFDENTTFSCDERFGYAKDLFIEFFEKKFKSKPQQGEQIVIDYLYSLSEEEYRLEVTPESIKAFASSQKGALYAIQTLRQLAKLDCNEQSEINCCVIEDKPEYSWRGVSFDVVRHFFDINEIKRFIKLIALLKFNVLHLHLSDDQGFRIKIDKYPQLTDIGAYREGTQRRDGKAYTDNIRHGGFYTAEELKDLVDFAKRYGIEIVPEIDIPGHTVAITASMPELGCTGKNIAVSTRFGILKDILCAGNEKTYAVLKDIFDVIIDIFPSKYIHLGGDEAPKDNWKQCPHCQEKIKSLGLKNEEELQAYMFNYFAQYLASKGKTVIGWNECLEGTLSKDIIVQHWTPKQFGKNPKTANYTNEGGKVIVSDFLKTYFDYPYAMTPLRKTYSFDPLTTLKGANRENILGGECNIWAEYIPDREKLDFNVFPRILAFSERIWSKKKLSYKCFVKRLQGFYPVLDALEVGYAKGMEKPQCIIKRIHIVKKMFTNDAFVELKKQK